MKTSNVPLIFAHYDTDMKTTSGPAAWAVRYTDLINAIKKGRKMI